MLLAFIFWPVFFSFGMTASIRKPGCIFENKFHELGSNFTDKLCLEHCQCLGSNGLYMYVCQPLCQRYASDCAGEVLGYNKITLGLPYYKCTCVEAICDESVQEPIQY